ncbi:MAG: hypothetical protein BKP49_04560 [Treponema sp. CETP13]|nr:MAG: hypothetical protein BKP49_04560 [Treponema sp. CETP13]
MPKIFIFVISLCFLVFIHFITIKRLHYKNKTTRLWNNTKFLTESAHLLKSKTQNYAMIQFNIANFRYFNNSYGHDKGDELLFCLAQCIKRNISKKNELCGYIWGDYFAVLLRYTSTQELENRIHIIADMFKKNAESICNFRYVLKCGVAISLSTSEGLLEECRISRNLLERTNHVLNEMPEPYTTAIQYYTVENEKNILFFKQNTQTVSLALENHEFHAFYQPKYNIHTGRICGAEALVRWINAENMIIRPDNFIPYCENTGLVIEIDRTIFEQACIFLHNRLKENRTVVPISTNFSRLHAQDPKLVEYITSVMKKYEVPSNLIEIELTETTVGEHQDIVFNNFKRLRKEGFLVAIDDFGSGYSSLGILDHLDIDVIKMDQSFMGRKKITTRRFQVLSSMIHLAKKLGLTVVCEGIETPEHVLTLDKAGGEIAQGFFYSQPISLSLFHEELDKRDSSEGLKENVDSLKNHFSLSFSEKIDIVDIKELETIEEI